MYGKKKKKFFGGGGKVSTLLLCFYDPLLSYLDSITLDFSIDMEIR